MDKNNLSKNAEIESKEITEYINQTSDVEDDEYDIKMLTSELYKLDSLYQQKCKECEVLQQQIDLLTNIDDEYPNDANNENVNTEIESFSKNISLIEEIELLKDKIQTLEDEKRELEYEVEHYHNYTEEIEKEKISLQDTISKMKDIELLDNSINTNYETILNENKNLKEENEKYKTELIAKDKEIGILSNEIKNIERVNLIEKHYNEYHEFIENKITEMKDMLSENIDLNKMEELTNKMVEISKQLKEKEDKIEENNDILMDLSNQLAEIEEENTKLKDLLPYRDESNSFASVGSNDYPYSPSVGSTGEYNDYQTNNNNNNSFSPSYDNKNNESSIKSDIIDSIEYQIEDLKRKEGLIDENDEKKDKMEEEINRMNSLMEETNKELENIEKSINEIKAKVDNEIKHSKETFS